MAIDDVSAWDSEMDSANSTGSPGPADANGSADAGRAASPGLSRDQELLWGDWGGVVLIAGILIAVVVVLTLTVGAPPL